MLILCCNLNETRYISTSFDGCKPTIRVADLDRNLLEFIVSQNPGARRFVDRILLNGEIFECLAGKSDDLGTLSSLESKMVSLMAYRAPEVQSHKVLEMNELNETLSRIHLFW